MQIHLSSPIDVSGFRAESTRLLAGQIAPETIDWHALANMAFEAPVASAASRPVNGRSAATAIVPRSFLRLTELVVLHRDEERFSLLYRLLWRLVHEPKLRDAGHDADLSHAASMAHAVRRDIYKMKAGVALRPIGTLGDEELLFAWYEPVHHIAEEVGAWLAQTRRAACWFLATPDRCVFWHAGRLACGPGVPAAQAPAPQDDARWLELARRHAAGETS